MVYLGEKYKGHTDWGRSCSREQCSPLSTLWRDTDTGSAGTRNMADTWRSNGSLDSCPLLDASNQNIRQHMVRSHPPDTGSIAQHKNISTSGTSVVNWWVSHSPQHTPLIMIAWRKKRLSHAISLGCDAIRLSAPYEFKSTVMFSVCAPSPLRCVGFEAGKEGAYLSKLYPDLMNGFESRPGDCPHVLPKTAHHFLKFYWLSQQQIRVPKDPDAACNQNGINSWLYSKSADLCKDTSPHDPDTKVYSYNAS